MNSSSEVTLYLKNLSPEDTKALQALREMILSTEPNLKEGLSRGVPFFYLHGKRVVGFRSSKTHLSFFIMEGSVLADLRDEFCNFKSSSTVIQFSAQTPLPKSLVRKLVLARISEIKKILK